MDEILFIVAFEVIEIWFFYAWDFQLNLYFEDCREGETFELKRQNHFCALFNENLSHPLLFDALATSLHNKFL